MTRRKATGPVWVNLSRREDGPVIVHLPGHRPGEPCAGCDATPRNPCLRERYTATARVRRDGRALLAVSIEDRDTGATFEWAVRKDRVAMAALPPDGKGRDRLWRDGCRIVGLAHRGGGRPPGLTTIAEDDELRKPIGEMRRDRRRTTLRNVAAYSGFTVSEIRGYLRVTDRTWAEFLSSF